MTSVDKPKKKQSKYLPTAVTRLLSPRVRKIKLSLSTRSRDIILGVITYVSVVSDDFVTETPAGFRGDCSKTGS